MAQHPSLFSFYDSFCFFCSLPLFLFFLVGVWFLLKINSFEHLKGRVLQFTIFYGFVKTLLPIDVVFILYTRSHRSGIQNGTTTRWAVRRRSFWYTQHTSRNTSWTDYPVVCVVECSLFTAAQQFSHYCILLTHDRTQASVFRETIFYPQVMACHMHCRATFTTLARGCYHIGTTLKLYTTLNCVERRSIQGLKPSVLRLPGLFTPKFTCGVRYGEGPWAKPIPEL